METGTQGRLARLSGDRSEQPTHGDKGPAENFPTCEAAYDRDKGKEESKAP